MRDKAVIERSNQVAEQVLAAAIAVHRELGPGLLESAYEACLEFELIDRGLRVERQKECPVIYRGLKIDCAYRIDLFVEEVVIVELKAVGALAPIHEAQLLSYLKLTKCWLGLLLNFHERLLKQGIKRIVFD